MDKITFQICYEQDAIVDEQLKDTSKFILILINYFNFSKTYEQHKEKALKTLKYVMENKKIHECKLNSYRIEGTNIWIK